MTELIQQYSIHIAAEDGNLYNVRAYGEPRADGTWEGWLEFSPVLGGSALQTGVETTQPNRAAVAYWASGLEPVYFEGAFERALYNLVPA